jgi:hypothetical protein
MKFTVVRKPAAERQLTEIWLEATDRNSVTAATKALESALSTRPDDVGESRPLDCRIAFVAPLALTFRVTVADRLVEVVSVRRV